MQFFGFLYAIIMFGIIVCSILFLGNVIFGNGIIPILIFFGLIWAFVKWVLTDLDD